MKKLMFISVLYLTQAIYAMNQKPVVLIGNDGVRVQLEESIASNIPTIQLLISSSFTEGTSRIIKSHLFNSKILNVLCMVVQEVYTNADILKLDKQFFEETNSHPAYSPDDIPYQVRVIVQKIVEQQQVNVQELIQAGNLFGVAWIGYAQSQPDSKSIADWQACNLSIDSYKNQSHGCALKDVSLVSLVGFYLVDTQNLITLNLDNNSIAEIPNNIFKDLSCLTVLSLTKNKISRISRTAFNGLTNLKTLALSDNQIYHIDKYALSKQTLPRLHTLYLGRNNLTRLSKKILVRLGQLLYYDRRYNKFNKQEEERMKKIIRFYERPVFYELLNR